MIFAKHYLGTMRHYVLSSWKKQPLFCNKGNPDNSENLWKKISIE